MHPNGNHSWNSQYSIECDVFFFNKKTTWLNHIFFLIRLSHRERERERVRERERERERESWTAISLS